MEGIVKLITSMRLSWLFSDLVKIGTGNNKIIYGSVPYCICSVAFAIWILKITFLYNVNLKCKILHRPIKSRSFTFIIIFELDCQITKLTNKQYKAMLTKLFRTRYRYIFIISLYLVIELKGGTV